MLVVVGAILSVSRVPTMSHYRRNANLSRIIDEGEASGEQWSYGQWGK
jgi:hypothetical protein